MGLRHPAYRNSEQAVCFTSQMLRHGLLMLLFPFFFEFCDVDYCLHQQNVKRDGKRPTYGKRPTKQCVAACMPCCSVLQCACRSASVLQCACRVALCCIVHVVLQCVAVCCSVLQCAWMLWRGWLTVETWTTEKETYKTIDWFWLPIFPTDLVRGLSNKEMKFQNKGAVPVQITPLLFIQPRNQNQSMRKRDLQNKTNVNVVTWMTDACFFCFFCFFCICKKSMRQ